MLMNSSNMSLTTNFCENISEEADKYNTTMSYKYHWNQRKNEGLYQ